MRKSVKEYLVTVFPFTRAFVPFCEQSLSYEGTAVQIQELVSLKGMGIDGMDAGYVDNRGTVGRKVGADLWAALKNCNALLLAEGNYNEKTQAKLAEYAEQAMDLGKHVFCGVRFTPEEIETLRAKSEKEGVNFFYLPSNPLDMYNGKPQRMYRPKASVVFVGEVLEGVNAVDVVLALTRHFREKNYRASAIFSSDIAKLCGAHLQSEYAILNRPEDQKIEALNYAIKQIDTEEVPDVLIVQLPGGMISMSDIATNQFGVYAYMWSQAVTPDYFVLCSPFQVLDETKYDELSLYFQHRYGYGINCVNLSNATLDTNNLAQFLKVSLTFVPISEVIDYVSSHREEATVPLYCVLGQDDQEKLCACVETVLNCLGDAQAL